MSGQEEKRVVGVSQEKAEIIRVETIANESLRAAKRIHDDLGPLGEEIVKKNQFGDTALRVDIEAEEAVLNVLRAHNVPIMVVSEEHGTVVIGGGAKYLGVLDGLDGTGVYKEERGKGKYGTMLGIYTTRDPSYEQYVYGGIMMHSQNQLYYAARNRGCLLLGNNKVRSLQCVSKPTLDKITAICADLNYDVTYGTDILTTRMRRFKDFNVLVTRSFAAHFVDFVEGKVDAVIGFTRKYDLEIAAAFPLITESGGTVIDISGKYLADQNYNELKKHLYVPFICASTKGLANDIRLQLIGQS